MTAEPPVDTIPSYEENKNRLYYRPGLRFGG